MKTTNEGTGSPPLSKIFDEAWDVFTVDQMDEKVVGVILSNAVPPQNAAHSPTIEGIRKAAYAFCKENGNELLKAVQLLEGK